MVILKFQHTLSLFYYDCLKTLSFFIILFFYFIFLFIFFFGGGWIIVISFMHMPSGQKNCSFIKVNCSHLCLHETILRPIGRNVLQIKYYNTYPKVIHVPRVCQPPIGASCRLLKLSGNHLENINY